MTTAHRPYHLDVEEPSIIDGSTTWQTWSTYRGAAGALERLDRLRRKGYTVRIVNTDTGELVASPDTPSPLTEEPCPYCGGAHAEPSNGECLL